VRGARIEGDEEARIHDMIRDAGGRLTVTTRTVVSILLEGDRHLTADDVIAEAVRRAPGIAASTVYRVLQRLDELGAVEHVHSGHGPTFYHLRERRHVHLVCSECGGIVDVPDALLSGVARKVQGEYGFTIEPRHSALIGRCAT
jgi:Fur family ferric uptake transcriptional regulator